MHQIDPKSETLTPDDDSLYLYVNNDIEYGLFEDIVDSYYLDSHVKDNFQCDHDCYSQHKDLTIEDHSNTCTHDYHHIAQSIQDLSDSTQQNNLHSIEENVSSFTDNTATPCDFNIIVYQADAQHERITDVYVGLVFRRVDSHLYTLDQILDFVKDIEGNLKVAHDALKAVGNLPLHQQLWGCNVHSHRSAILPHVPNELCEGCGARPL